MTKDEEVRKALFCLRNEVKGWLDLEIVRLAGILGYTNVGVMRDRLQKANEALDRWKNETDESGQDYKIQGKEW